MKSIGAVGLILVTVGVLYYKNDRAQMLLFAVGGVGLLVYGIYLKDPIFIPLEIVFVLSSLWGLLRQQQTKKTN